MATTYSPEQITENRRTWLAALRSGEYTQNIGRLHSDDFTSDCCLGVAHKLADPNWENSVKDFWARRDPVTGRLLSSLAYDQIQAYLGGGFVEEFSTPAGTYPSGRPYPASDTDSLISMNDGKELSFSQIADIAEAKWFPEDRLTTAE